MDSTGDIPPLTHSDLFPGSQRHANVDVKSIAISSIAISEIVKSQIQLLHDARSNDEDGIVAKQIEVLENIGVKNDEILALLNKTGHEGVLTPEAREQLQDVLTSIRELLAKLPIDTQEALRDTMLGSGLFYFLAMFDVMANPQTGLAALAISYGPFLSRSAVDKIRSMFGKPKD